MKISFIIVTYQRNELLGQCLASIYAQKNLPRPFEVIVIDNDGGANVNPPADTTIRLHIERTDTNLSATGGRNLGMEIASGDYLIFIDDDAVWYTQESVGKLLQLFEQNPDCGAIATKSVNPKTQQVIIEELPHPNKPYISQTERPIEVPYFYGFGYALRASVIEKIGDYPIRYFYYMEEVDLSLRLIDSGYRILYDPLVAVYHYKSALGRTIQGADYWYRSGFNKCRMAWRLLPKRYVISTLFIWSGYVFLKTRNPLVVLKMWRDLWQERQLLGQERRPIQPQTIQYLKRIGGRLLY